MLDAHLYFSDRLRQIAYAASTVLLLTGCSMTTQNTVNTFDDGDREFFEELKKNDQPDRSITTGSLKPSQESKVRKTGIATGQQAVGVNLRDSVSRKVESFDINPSTFNRPEQIEESAACRYLRKSAASEAIIIGSPSLTASTDDDGSGSVSVAMNLFDFKKARLVQASGDAKCRLREASRKIEATLGLGGEATKFARAWAKQDYIRSNMGGLNRIKAKTGKLVQHGLLTTQDAKLVYGKIEQLKAEMATARSEADQRQDLPAITKENIRSRHGALVEATNDLQNIEREIRTNDALELSVSAGYRYNGEFNSTLQSTNNNGAFAKVSLGIRLGALSRHRTTLEAEAAGARIDALFEENSGTIWKSGYSKKAIERVVAELRKSENSLASAIRLADETIAQLETNEQPETARHLLTVKIERIRLGSNQAALNAAIKQLQSNKSNIQALSD